MSPEEMEEPTLDPEGQKISEFSATGLLHIAAGIWVTQATANMLFRHSFGFDSGIMEQVGRLRTLQDGVHTGTSFACAGCTAITQAVNPEERKRLEAMFKNTPDLCVTLVDRVSTEFGRYIFQHKDIYSARDMSRRGEKLEDVIQTEEDMIELVKSGGAMVTDANSLSKFTDWIARKSVEIFEDLFGIVVIIDSDTPKPEPEPAKPEPKPEPQSEEEPLSIDELLKREFGI